ncbi:hypothetical protein BM536_017310 [Streptomyces phaeoluteigriseus]|uniref:Uncharacterized protein n=1 Tax=Streptomyces phaeoluteigriseus TaxID=114686 RepID=A0A1V6MRX9_9ACTN|nr:hypothetical protein [Streptomyces phaeoluteigriseus]OQD55210.1 hypothetical protein BM536_017310 [Streptomyces phaeoluteigriseus]
MACAGGAVVGADLLPAARAVFVLLPPGVVVRVSTDLSRFYGAHLAGPVITQAAPGAGSPAPGAVWGRDRPTPVTRERLGVSRRFAGPPPTRRSACR